MSSIPLSQLSSISTYATVTNVRLKSLYSDFTHQKHSNPTSYTSNVEWWRHTLEETLVRGLQSDSHNASTTSDKLVMHAKGVTFADRFRVEGVGKPLSIPTVIFELCSSKALIPLSEFLGATRSIYDPGWLPYRIASFVVRKPLWWALGQFGIVDSNAPVFGDSGTVERWKKVAGDYVVVSLLEGAAERIMERQRQKSTGQMADSLYNIDSFRAEFSECAFEGVPLSSLDVKVVLKFLERDKRVIVVQGEVIKFVEDGSTQAAEITAVDSGVLALKTSVARLEAQVESIQHSIDQRTQQISDALRQKRKEIAMARLRARKQLEQVMKQRLSSLELLQSTLTRVETSAGDIEVMQAYKSGAAVLRDILSHPLLQREKIDEVMEAVAEANADAREVNDAIQMGSDIARADASVDESELEDELQALVREVEAEKVQARLVGQELETPVHTPTLESASDDAERVRLPVAA